MAEGLGVASGVIAILQLAQVVTNFALDWKDAPKDIRELITELQSLKTVLSETKKLLSDPDFKEAFDNQRSAVLSELGPDASKADNTKLSIESCHKELDKLHDELKRSKGHKYGWKRFKGAFLKQRSQGSVDSLRHHCEFFNTLVSRDTTMLGVMNNKQTRQARQEQTERHHVEQEEEILKRKNAILAWLSNLNFEEKQRDILSKRHPGTGGKLLDSDKFKAWRDGHDGSSSTLWCSGIRESLTNACLVVWTDKIDSRSG